MSGFMYDQVPDRGMHRRLADALRLRRVHYVCGGDIKLLPVEDRLAYSSLILNERLGLRLVDGLIELPMDMDVALTRYYRLRVPSLPAGSLARVWIDTTLTVVQDLVVVVEDCEVRFKIVAMTEGPYFSPILETV